MKKGKIFIVLVSVVFVALIGCRIWWVNKNARLPEYEYYNQGETLEYKGFKYTITDAIMVDYNDFFLDNPSYIDRYVYDDYEKKIILVYYKVEKVVEEPAVVETYIPIRFENLFNEYDPFLFQAMNPALYDGSFSSGDIMTVPYEVYEINSSEERWDKVTEFDYRVVFGSYPVRKEMRLNNIQIQ